MAFRRQKYKDRCQAYIQKLKKEIPRSTAELDYDKPMMAVYRINIAIYEAMHKGEYTCDVAIPCNVDSIRHLFPRYSLEMLSHVAFSDDIVRVSWTIDAD